MLQVDRLSDVRCTVHRQFRPVTSDPATVTARGQVHSREDAKMEAIADRNGGDRDRTPGRGESGGHTRREPAGPWQGEI